MVSAGSLGCSFPAAVRGLVRLLRGVALRELELHDRGTLLHERSDLDEQLDDLPRLGRGHLEACLVGLEHDERILHRDGVPHVHEQLHDRDVREVPMSGTSTITAAPSAGR